VFLYELLDAYPDPKGTLAGNHFGLFDSTNAPKPAAVALHNLTQILGHGAGRSIPGSLNVSVDTPTRTLLLQKAPGVFDLIVWDEQSIWNRQAHAPVAATAHARTIHFGAVQQTIAVLDPMHGTAPVAIHHAAAAVTVMLGDAPLIIEVNG
jgi:hypothetical protein